MARLVFDRDTRTHALVATQQGQVRGASADGVHAAWVGFATRGEPGWPKYTLDRRATMRFDTGSEVVDDPRAMERELWEGVR